MIVAFGGGKKLYQQRARHALPLLVARAKAGMTVSYGQLAKELGMPNPRNLNYVLGAVGYELVQLGKKWGEKIPPIECIVTNKTKHTPGKGIGFHMSYEKFEALTPMLKKQVLKELNRDIFSYRRWDDVLRHFGIAPVIPADILEPVATKARYGKAGAESEEHIRLKDYIAQKPRVVGVTARVTPKVEYAFPSADEIDVLFKGNSEWIGVEVKSASSDDADLMRGIFQCVKYQALLESVQKYEQHVVNSRVILALGGSLPPSLAQLANLLAIEVCSAITVPNNFRFVK